MSQLHSEETSKILIHKKIRRSIMMGHSESGTRLNVDAIAKEYNTSVTPVRDALQMLSHEGLVVIKPRSGYFVATITLKQLRDLLDVRRILELSAVERATLRITSEQTQGTRVTMMSLMIAIRTRIGNFTICWQKQAATMNWRKW
jgi:DNA-binding GntR family transcriptional regulator